MIPSDELEKLTADAKMIIDDDSKLLSKDELSWQLKGNYHRIVIPVVHSLKVNANLDILVQVNRSDSTIFCFVLRRNHLKRVVRYCPDNSKPHRNRLYDTRRFDSEKHKHIWTMLGDNERVRGDESHYAYAPQDGISGTDFREAFPTFLQECNIRLSNGSALPPLPTETTQDDLFLYP